MMGSSDRLFSRQRTVHEILGGGLFADVILWRHKKVTKGILIVTLTSWVVFERSGYTLLSLVSSVLFLQLLILYLWAKSAEILNRPAPPLPQLQLSEEMVNEAATLIRDRINALLSTSRDIALGKDSKTLVKVGSYLLLISVIGSLTDFVTLCYISLFVILTVPALYERYEEHVDASLLKVNMKLKQLYIRFDEECVGRLRKWILENKKLS